MGIEFIFFNHLKQKTMRNEFLDMMAASEQVTMMMLKKADSVRPNQRQQMCKDYSLRNGVFSRV